VSTWRRACATVVVPLLLAAGCAGGSEDGGPTSPGGPEGTPNDVVSVRLVVSGGIAGTRQVYSVGGGGRTRSPRVARILALAGEVASSPVAGKVRRGTAPCCDMQVYDLTIRRADGSRTHIRTPQTRTGPPALQRLVTLLSATG
jgi:hypothetical protein